MDAKAAAAITKLKSKVDRLRRERDEAEKQAAVWLRAEQEKLARAAAQGSGGDHAAPVATVNGSGGGAPPGGGGGAVVASLRAEGLQLKRELQEAREEAERLRRTSSQGAMDSGASLDSGGDPTTRAVNGVLKVSGLRGELVALAAGAGMDPLGRTELSIHQLPLWPRP